MTLKYKFLGKKDSINNFLQKSKNKGSKDIILTTVIKSQNHRTKKDPEGHNDIYVGFSLDSESLEKYKTYIDIFYCADNFLENKETIQKEAYGKAENFIFEAGKVIFDYLKQNGFNVSWDRMNRFENDYGSVKISKEDKKIIAGFMESTNKFPKRKS